MKTKIVLATAFIAAVAVAPAHARIVTNGFTINGNSLNGQQLNGQQLNGIRQGLSNRGPNGIDLNGTVIRIEF